MLMNYVRTVRISFHTPIASYFVITAHVIMRWVPIFDRHTLLVLTSIRIRGSEMFSPAPQSLSLGRWRVTELGDDELQNWEMTEVTRRRWRVWQSRDDECEAVVDTSKLERRWRKGRRGDDECEAVVDTSKHERRWRKRVLWDDVELCGKFMSETPLGVWVRCRWVYGWDTNTCMGEIPR